LQDRAVPVFSSSAVVVESCAPDIRTRRTRGSPVYSDETPGREFVDQARASLSADVVRSANEVGSKLTIGEALDLARLAQTTAT
jgi:hypothetical protein